ncbi:MAG: aspartyl-tRNA synthetase [Chthoniobacterales bacterium]|nr:aspartyl-tRNA synthetase [Chthoniobacterales bacterium]
MRTVTLNEKEREILSRQDPTTESDGGYQKLLVTLQYLLDSESGTIELPAVLLERIPRYAFDYGNGGWEDRLTSIFSRTLGDRLGR